MSPLLEQLARLHYEYFPELQEPTIWLEQLSSIAAELRVDVVDFVPYFQALFEFERQRQVQRRDVLQNLRGPFGEWGHLADRVTVMIHSRDSSRWLQPLFEFYREANVQAIVAIPSEANVRSRGEGTPWTLQLYDDELPTPTLMRFVDEATRHSRDVAWGFRLVDCRLHSLDLEYSQFLSFGPFAAAACERRLISNNSKPSQQKAAPVDALIVRLDWVLRPFAERLEAPAASRINQALWKLRLKESIPERWHLFAPAPKGWCVDIAGELHRASLGEGEVANTIPVDADSFPEPTMVRDAAILEAEDHFSRSDVDRGSEALNKLQAATIDHECLHRSDRFLPQVAAGKRLVATFNPRRVPRDNEFVIVYGNYPHQFANIVVNNPVKRHITMFGEWSYDEVEYDERWDGIDRIYIINGDRADRYEAVLRELSRAGAPLHKVERIAAIQDRTSGQAQIDGQIGCLRSHIDALRAARSARCENALVVEDDFCFTSDIDIHLNDLRTFVVRRYDYWVCLLATSKYGKIVPFDDLLSLTFQPCTNASAYLVSSPGCDRVLETQEYALERLRTTLDPTTYAVDRYWSVLQRSNKFFVFARKCGFQATSFSDIERRITSYLD